MDRASDELLAGARLAQHQHRRVGRRDLTHDVEDAHHLGIATNDPLEPIAAVELGAHVLVGQVLVVRFEALLDLGAQLGQINRLLDVVGGTLLHRIDGDLSAAVPGQHHDAPEGVAVARLLEHREAVVLLHHHVGDDHSEVALLQLL